MTAPVDAINVELEVPFHDVDALRVVWHGHYYKYLEIARTELMRSRDLDIEQVENAGFRMVVIETRCRHSFPLKYGDRFRVDAWFADYDNRIRVRFEVHNLTQGRRAAKAHTIMATTDSEGNLLFETPPLLRERIAVHE